MTPDELSRRLKRAGQPIDTIVDPVPLIRQRALALRRRRAASAAALTAVLIAGFGFVDHNRSEGLSSDTAAPSTIRSPRSQGLLPEAIQASLLPKRLGNHTKVTDMKVPPIGTDDPAEGYGPTLPGDQLRIAYMCKGAVPADAGASVKVHAARPEDKVTSAQLTIILPNCLLDTPQVVETQIPQDWPTRSLWLTVSHRDGNQAWSVDAMAAVYRKPPG